MSVTTPEWLSRHDAELRGVAGSRSFVVALSGAPVYLVEIIPVQGKYSPRVKQSNSGKRLDKGSVHASPEAALSGGLEELRLALGW